MKDLYKYVKESSEENNYCIQYAYYSDERFSYSFASSLKRAQSMVKKLHGAKAIYIYVVPSNNIDEFKKLVKKNNDELIKDLYTERYVKSYFRDKDETNLFLDKK